MSLLQNELKIRKIRELFQMKLTLPSYQRPYRWSKKSAITLFQDTYHAFQEGVEEYRLGTVILHKENGKYNIVDGQQRLTTLSILLYCLNWEDGGLLQEKYSPLSNHAIVMNFEILSRQVNELEEMKDLYKEYLLDRCTVVQIVTDSEQEAFQFFDSQNSRGKGLKPHDLLKSYHLREMNEEDETEKVKMINQWENMKESELDHLFKNYLYPLTHWYKEKNGLDYSSETIDVFKGIKTTNVFNYAIYHKASNLFTEQFNANGSSELLASNWLNQFQLTHPPLAGRRFFKYTFHYKKLLEKVRKLINKVHTKEQIPSKRSGDIYIKRLYECVLLFFADRFGMDCLSNKGVMEQFYTWCYSLRLSMMAVYPETVNTYAQKGHERINNGLKMFSIICEMNHPNEIKHIVLEKPNVIGNNKEKYKDVYELLWKWNGW